MKSFNPSLKLLCVILCLVCSINCRPGEGESDATQNPVQVLLEYKEALPEDAFSKLIDIYSNESIALIDREKAAVDYFSRALSREVKDRMPVPFGFRKLPQEVQARIKAIYYQSGMNFEEKLMRIGMIITENMPRREYKTMRNNLNATRLGLIEFRVNVTLTLNGLYTMDQLNQVLTTQELEQVAEIQKKDSSNEVKANAIGQILQEAYRRSPQLVQDQWPAIFGSHQFPEDLKKATTYMLFSDNPSKNMNPFVKVFRQAYLQDVENNGKGNKKRDIGHYRHTRANRHTHERMLLQEQLW